MAGFGNTRTFQMMQIPPEQRPEQQSELLEQGAERPAQHLSPGVPQALNKHWLLSVQLEPIMPPSEFTSRHMLEQVVELSGFM